MSQVKIKRFFRSVDITLHTATALATTLRVEDVAGGVVSMGTISTNAASLQTWGALTADAAFRRLYNADGSVADITLAPSSTEGRMYALPDASSAVSVPAGAVGEGSLRRGGRLHAGTGRSPCAGTARSRHQGGAGEVVCAAGAMNCTAPLPQA